MLPFLKTKTALIFASLLVLLALSLGGGLASKGVDTASTYENLKLFTEVLSIVQNQYVEEMEPPKLLQGAVRGMVNSLDPHSSFLDKESYREFQVDTSGSFGGLGIEITIADKKFLTVIAPIEGTPAHRAGIVTGDRIVKIEGIATEGLDILQAVKMMRGKPGTKVTISIWREGWTEAKDVTLVREVVRVQSVRSREAEKGIGVIRIRQFQERTAEDVESVLEKLEKNGLQGLILDLRGNPGGLLTSAVEVAEKFLEDGKLVVYTEGRVKQQNMRLAAHARRPRLGFPMVVLVDKGSASASEIVAGAIQDWGRGVVLGTTTHGKGSVQTIIPLSDGSGLRLTTAMYFTPKGRTIHNKGITPDIVVEPPAKAPEPQSAELPKPQSEAEELKKDIQLQRAIEILKASQILGKNREKSRTEAQAR